MNLNFIEFMKQKPMKERDMKFKRTLKSQGGNTFDDIKQNLIEFSKKNRKSLESRYVSRDKRMQVVDLLLEGNDVGTYTPKFSVLDPEATAQSFNGSVNYVPEKKRMKLIKKLRT